MHELAIFFDLVRREARGHALCVDFDHFGIKAFGGVRCFILTRGYGGR